MKDADVVAAFSALGQPKRLEAFKLLLTREPDGLHAGDLARIMDTPFNTMSAHMAILVRTGLVSAAKKGRYITYRVDIPEFVRMMAYLFKDCCASRPDLRSSLFDEFSRMNSKSKSRAKTS
ncbi:metalloregulator ArsR/SmtB family transcription factor [Roseiarcaceae bacterium H3SJ34-1]|uniref:ArsR/SmtB family transcription factor n=1 Tax=Terripilifer ovatus TaxID=3032367 RepID=UPI003AB9B0B5|nr:metalloregulator ArsR/SmtB family transcription factor [Roseiarcaceae bacterium H3SJ34-1]